MFSSIIFMTTKQVRQWLNINLGKNISMRNQNILQWSNIKLISKQPLLPKALLSRKWDDLTK